MLRSLWTAASGMNGQQFNIDTISNNQQLYQAFKQYASGDRQQEVLNAEEQKYLKESLEDFGKAGLNLPADQQEVVKDYIQVLLLYILFVVLILITYQVYN